MNKARGTRGVSRRRLLKALGWTAGGLTVLYLVGRRFVPVFPSTSTPRMIDGAAWLQVRADGTIAMLSPAHELGQGSSLGLAQIAAEELNVDVSDIAVSFPTTLEVPEMRFTTGSQAIALHARPVAEAAARLREELRRRAGKLLGLAPADLRDSRGGFTSSDGRRVAFADLTQGSEVIVETETLPPARLYTFDKKRKHHQIGKPAAPIQADDLVRGRPIFAADVRLPGMVYGRAIQPPLTDAEISGVNLGEARNIAGVVDIVVDRKRNFVGAVAETPGALTHAVDEIKVTWDRPEPYGDAEIENRIDIDMALARGRLEHRIADDDIAVDGPWNVDVRVDLPALHHAAQELRSAVVRFGARNGREIVDIWTGSQDIFVNQKKAAAELGWSVDRVEVHAMRVGGAFGGRAIYDVVRDALLLARAVKRPVKVEWSRRDEFLADRTRPPSSHRVRIKTDAAGRISDWWQASVSGHVLLTEIIAPEWVMAPLRMVTHDFGATRGINGHYAAHRRRIEFADVMLPFYVGQWRSIGATPNNFAIETAIDELAVRLDRHPVELRLQNIPPRNVRLAICLKRVHAMCNANPRPDDVGFGRGYACGIYHEHSYVAVAFDVAINRNRQRIDVLRAYCAQDVGLAVSPDQIRAQIEGCVMMAIGQVLMEKAPIGRGGLSAERFSDYPTPTIAHTPQIEIELLGNPEVEPAGVGETALIAAVPALANAIRNASGHRISKLPVRFEDVTGNE